MHSEEEEKDFEISIITDMDEPEDEQSKTPARTSKLENAQDKPYKEKKDKPVVHLEQRSALLDQEEREGNVIRLGNLPERHF